MIAINQSINLFANCATDTVKQCKDGNVAQRRATRKADAHLAGAQINTKKSVCNNHTTGDRQADKETDRQTDRQTYTFSKN